MSLAKPLAASLLLFAVLLPATAAAGDEKGAPTVQPMASKRALSAGRAALDLGGQTQLLDGFEGTALRLDGGAVSRDGKSTARATATVRCEEFTVELPATPEPFVTQWIADALAGNPKVQDGAVVESDATMKATFVHRLRELQLRSLELGELDASSKERAGWSATLAASSVKWEKGDGKETKAAGIGAKAKAALASNFRVTIGGVAYDRVAKVGPLHVDFPAAATTGDGSRATREAAGGPRVAVVKLTIAEADPKEWLAWLDDAAAKGAGAARSGSIELLDPSRKEVIVKIALEGLLPSRISRDSGDEKAPRLVVELSCGAVKIDPAKQ